MTLGIQPAHGIGGRADLPLPGEVVLQAGGFVVLVSFLAVGLLWQRSKFGVDGTAGPGGAGGAAGWPLPGVVQRLADSTTARAALRWAALVLLAYLLVMAFTGTDQININPAPRALYVLVWVGVVPASLLFGPVWRVLNPLRALYTALLCIRIRNTPAGEDRQPLRRGMQSKALHTDTHSGPLRMGMQSKGVLERLGYRPAAVGLAAFVWLELVPADRAEPQVVGCFIAAYVVLVTAGAVVFGEQWFERGDPFEVYSTLIAALSPIGRAPDRTVVLRNPLRGLAAIKQASGLVAVLAVWWGSTVFDGVSGTPMWVNWLATVHARDVVATAVLLVMCGVVGASYRLSTGAMARSLVTTLVPIAVGYSIAHYASLLLTEGPRGLGLLVGVAVTPVNPAPLLIAAIQVTAILVGHVAGVVAAHDRVLALVAVPVSGTAPPGSDRDRDRDPDPDPGADPGAEPPTGAAGQTTAGRRLADQVPLVLVMIVYTMVGLYLLVIA